MKSTEMTGGMTLYFIKRQPHSSKPCTVATKQSYLSGKLHQWPEHICWLGEHECREVSKPSHQTWDWYI